MSEQRVIAFINNDVVLAIPVEEAKKYELTGDAKDSALSQISEADSDVVGQSLFNVKDKLATGVADSRNKNAWVSNWKAGEDGSLKFEWSPWTDL